MASLFTKFEMTVYTQNLQNTSSKVIGNCRYLHVCDINRTLCEGVTFPRPVPYDAPGDDVLNVSSLV